MSYSKIKNTNIPSKINTGHYNKFKTSSAELRQEAEELIIDDYSIIQKNSTNKSFFLLFKAFIGSGVLFLPRGFASAGLIPSVFMLTISAYFSTIGMELLAEVSLLHSGTYWELGNKLYGNTLRLSILWSIFLSQLGFAMCYVLFIAQNIKDMISTLTNCEFIIKNYMILILLQLVIYIPFCFLNNLKKLSQAIVFASGLICVGVVYILFNSIYSISKNGAQVILFTDWTDTFLILGTSIYSFEGIGLVIPIATSMEKPYEFSKILSLVISSVLIIYFSVAILGSLAFGSSTASIILLNLESTPFLLIVQFLYVISIILSVPLQLFPAYEIAESFIPNSHANLTIITRITTTIGVCIGAFVTSSSLDLLVSFIGTIGCIPIGFIYPALLHLKLGNLKKKQMSLDYMLISAGGLFMIVSSVITLMKWSSGKVPAEITRCTV
eukprot:NODE_292_length_11597_cov_0.265177.p2 type:complete len:440 gc:universal NODE_292_length_11597_cov_0.265177:4107-2788(-)